MLLFLANIGEVLADVFRYMYAKVFLMGCLKKREPSSYMFKHKPTMANEPNGPSAFNGRGRSIEVFPDSQHKMIVSQGTQIKQRIIKPNDAPINIQTLDSAALESRRRAILQRRDSQREHLVVDQESDEEDDREWEAINNVSVPVTVSMGIIALYIFGGALLFKYWEEWDLTQASYFCFITLSTIGFGDITPGRDFKDSTANARLIIGSIYSIFGMAILSMSFSLMQEELVSKFAWLGRKLGIIEEDSM